MNLAADVAALIAVVSTGVVYGTDVFCAVVQRPGLARVDHATLTAIMGNVHRFGDRRLPIPGILGIISAATACVFAALAARPFASVAAGAALALLAERVIRQSGGRNPPQSPSPHSSRHRGDRRSL